MHWDNDSLRFSPSDLTVFLDGEFSSWMDRWYAGERAAVKSPSGEKKKLPTQFKAPHTCVANCSPDNDDELKLVARMGSEHEATFLATLKKGGLTVVECPNGDNGYETTLAAMKNGASIIYQANLRMDPWRGLADFLARLPGESSLGSFHYEVWDTKLARSAKPYFIMQLCAYAEMLEHIQGVRPREIEIILGDGRRVRFATNKFFFYYREFKQLFVAFHKNFDPASLPHPGDSSNYGRWSSYAGEIFKASDDLACVARMTRVQAKKFRDAGITTMVALATCAENSVTGITSEIFQRQTQQAALQLQSRGRETPAFTILTPAATDPRRGLAVLPVPSAGDIFFDMEGYPFVLGGLEYLFGAVHLENAQPQFVDWWAHDDVQEKVAFEQFIDWAFARWKADPSMHIYHYANYEVHAMRRLMGKFATREHEVDELLRNEVFVDLYTIVRQGMLVGTSSYSLKEIEKLYLKREGGGVTTAGGSVVAYQRWLDNRDGETWQKSKTLAEIRDYNRVDCESTLQLRDWLVGQQKNSGIVFIASPKKAPKENAEAEAPKVQPSTELANALLRQIADGKVPNPARRPIQELLAWLLEFHWREAKPVYWKMFDRHDMTEDELVQDLDCLGALSRTTKPRAQIKRSWGYEYQFDPEQDTKLREGKECYFAHNLAIGCGIVSFDAEKGLVEIRLGPSAPEPPARLSLIPNEYVKPEPIPSAIFRYVKAWSENTILSRAVDDLLSRRPPRVVNHPGGPLIAGSPTTVQIVDIAARLDSSTLCIQGPPGTGKTYTAAEIIVKLVGLGKSVGITSNGHKAILNTMRAVKEAADSKGQATTLIKVGGENDDEFIKDGRIQYTKSELNPGVIRAGVVVGGTAWVFSREELVNKFDYLIVDEAGQVSLANVVAVGQAARNLILVGDQMQLAQPIQGSHPGESGKSALDYLLQDKATVPPEFGIFLDTTWRMHPQICSFISEAIYDGRLKNHPDTAKQMVKIAPTASPAFKVTCGIAFVEVPHQFNSQASDEEIEAIKKIVGELLGRTIVNRDGREHPLTLEDILVVAPYNMQVRRLKDRLGDGARVGSVDKFQGQQAAVVIVSMCASSAEDVPRGIEFILNKNRLNVAISRAKCLAIVVGCRGLMAPRCTSIAQMEMANLYCWLAASAEKAHVA